MQLVEGGFTVNGKSFDITDNWNADFEKQTIQVGKTNTFSAKVYSLVSLRWIQFMFGIPQIGDAHLAETVIQVWLDGNREVKHVTVNQKNNLINIESVIASAEMKQCAVKDIGENCYSVTVSASFDEAPSYDIFALNGVDIIGQSHVTFLNGGFAVAGDPLNPPEIDYIALGKEGLVQMIRYDKFENLWVDPNAIEHEKFDNLWVSPYEIVYTKNDWGTWIRLSPYPMIERNDPLTTIIKRIHSDFVMIKQIEIDKAIKIFDSSLIQNKIFHSLSYTYPDRLEKLDRLGKLDDPEVQKRMIQEIIRAEKYLKEVYENRYPASLLFKEND